MKRVNLRAILADPVLRRELCVQALQAIQASAGIETTLEQAGCAYDRVRKEQA